MRGASSRVVATAGHVDHGKSALIVAAHRDGPRPAGRGEAPRAHDRPRVRVVHAAVAAARSGSSTCPATSGSSRTCWPGVGPGAAGAVRRRRRRGMEAAVRGAPRRSSTSSASQGAVRGADEARPGGRGDASRSRREEVRERLAGTRAGGRADRRRSRRATGEGLDELRRGARRDARRRPGAARDARTRLFVDRVFTIRGAGHRRHRHADRRTASASATRSSCSRPAGAARIRGLQTHKRARAARLPGLARRGEPRRRRAGRGSSAATSWRRPGPGARPRRVEAAPSGRSAASGPRHHRPRRVQVYAGAAEAEAKIRFRRGPDEAAASSGSGPRSRWCWTCSTASSCARPVGGSRSGAASVLDSGAADPRGGPAGTSFLARRARADANGAARIARGANGASSAPTTSSVLTGGPPLHCDRRVGRIRRGASTRRRARPRSFLAAHHREHPLEEGAPLAAARERSADAARAAGCPAAPRGRRGARRAAGGGRAPRAERPRPSGCARTRCGSSHAPTDVEQLVAAVSGAHEAQPPTVKELVAAGFARGAHRRGGARRRGRAGRARSDRGAVARRSARPPSSASMPRGLTVAPSAKRSAPAGSTRCRSPSISTAGVTRRDGDLRFPRAPGR